MRLTLDVDKILLLDTPFNPKLLNNNQAIIGELEGKSVLMVNVDLEEIRSQIKKQS